MNYTQSISIFFLVLYVCCNAAEQPNNYKSIPFNRGAIECNIRCIRYNTDKDFIIAGIPGYEIQQNGLSKVHREEGYWNIEKDEDTVVVFSTKKILIANLKGLAHDMISLPKKDLIERVVLDSHKKTIFINYWSDPQFIRKYCYNSHSYTDFDFKHFGVNCIALSSSKDILYLFNHDTLSLRKTDDILCVVKESKIPIRCTSHAKVFGNKLAIGNDKAICIININKDESIANSYVLKNYPPVLESFKRIETIAFHSSGLLAALVSNNTYKGAIHYWNMITGRKVDKTTIRSRARDFCFSPDGCKLVIAFDTDCIEQSVSSKVINEYILLSLWIKLKTLQKQYNLPNDIVAYCIDLFRSYCS